MERPEPNPDQDRRVLLAVVLSFAILWAFSYFAPQPPLLPPLEDGPASLADDSLPTDSSESAQPKSEAFGGSEASTSKADDDDSAASRSEVSSETAPIRRAPLVESEVSWAGTAGVWTSRGGGPSSIHINAYQEAYEQQWIPTWLLSGFKAGFTWEPFTLACPESEVVNIIKDSEGVVLPVGIDRDGVDADLASYEVLPTGDPSLLAYRARRGDIEVRKSYQLPVEGHLSTYVVRFKNLGAQPREILPSFGVSDRIEPSDAGMYGSETEIWSEVGGDVEHQPSDKLDKKPRSYEGEVSWIAIGDRYFLVGLEPEVPLSGELVMRPSPVGTERYTAELRTAPITLEPGESRSFKFKLWAGPKELSSLQEAGLRMETAVDFGIFGVLSLPILAFLKWLNGLIGSWGLSIIALTVCIKLALFPLSQKSYRSMKGMQALQPEINVLKEKHGDDKEGLNREMMELWKSHGVNPMGGCLPMIIQMPIWFALYRVLWNSVELYQQPFLYFCDLSLRDPLGVFPIVLGATMFLQQKFTPNTATDPTQKMVMKFMPIFFSVIMFSLPAGLVVYILINNVLSIAQQWVIHRQHDDADPDKKAAASAT